MRVAAMLGVLVSVAVAASGCVGIASAQSTGDASTHASADASHRSHRDGGRTHARSSGVENPLATPQDPGLLTGAGAGALGGLGMGQACMTRHEAENRQTATGPYNGGGAGGGNTDMVRASRTTTLTCPDAIWTYVGAGHGAQPVGNVRAQLDLPGTRRAQRSTANQCCYLVPSPPGSPAG